MKYSTTVMPFFQEFFSLLCAIALFMVLYLLMKVEIELRQSERMANNEHHASLRRAELSRYGDRRWTRESENHRVRLPRRNHPMEHDERQDWYSIFVTFSRFLFFPLFLVGENCTPGNTGLLSFSCTDYV